MRRMLRGTSPVIASFFRDTFRSLRGWRRTPGSALLVVLALGLSGGALIALVSLFNALFWRELPVTRPEALIGVTGTDRGAPDWETVGMPTHLFASLESGQSVFDTFGAVGNAIDDPMLIRNMSQRIVLQPVSSRFFETLGLRPALGRLVSRDDVDSASPVATISYRIWQTRFGAAADVVGQTFRFQGMVLTIIGVAPPAFAGLDIGSPVDAWTPVSLAPRLEKLPSPNLIFFQAFVGRLRPGVTLEQAREQIEILWPAARKAAAEEYAPEWPGLRDDTLALEPRVASAARGFSEAGLLYRRPLLLLVLSSLITLALACANLSGLLLARWSLRENDLAVQSALGASRSRLVGQVIGESLSLSLLAVLLSTPLAVWSARSLVWLLWNQPDSAPLDLNPDYRVFAIIVALAVVVAVCVSVLPVIRVGSSTFMLTRTTRGMPGRRVARWGRGLVATQVTLSVPLLVTAWLIAVNLHRLETFDKGFRSDGVLVAILTNQDTARPNNDPAAYLAKLDAALHALPGVTAAAMSGSEPVAGFFSDDSRQPVSASDGRHQASPFVEEVSPRYFETLGVPIVAGRDFTWTDDGRQPDVAILSAGLAKTLFPGVDPIGRRVRLFGPRERLLDVIGVSADAKLAEPRVTNQSFLFISMLQQPPRILSLESPVVLLRSPLPPNAFEPAARRAILALGRDDVFMTSTLQHDIEAGLLAERVMRMGAFYFAGLTTLLVFVGLFAVVNFGLARRTPEIGLRLALGASRHDIRTMLLREALTTAGVGLIAGIPCAFLAGRVMASALIMVDAHDLLAFGTAIATVLIVTLGSILVPLRRASQITPLQALASE